MASLNNGQQKVFMETLTFLNDPNRKEHRISGGAGTGKTFLISKIVDTILKHVNSDVDLKEVRVTATTNKAASVLAEAIPHRRTDIGTIYSFMNLRVSQNFTTGQQKIVPTAKWVIHDKVLIVIDEASMINKTLKSYIEKGTTSNCKILYVGDKNQLSPVGESVSSVYTDNMSESILTQPVRNAEQPALMDLCKQCVETVRTGIFTPIIPVPGVIDIVTGPELQGILEREYHTEDKTKRLLCYTNRGVIDYNDYIRELRGYTDHYALGEVLSNNESAEFSDKTRMYTDQMVQVESRGTPYENTDIVKGHSVTMIDLVLKDIAVGTTIECTVFANPSDRREALNFYKKKDWQRFYKIKDNYPDLRAIACSTTHKAQGSTYQSVVVDMADIGTCTLEDQTARMQYVALSRPKSRLYIRGKLPERYFK